MKKFLRKVLLPGLLCAAFALPGCAPAAQGVTATDARTSAVTETSTEATASAVNSVTAPETTGSAADLDAIAPTAAGSAPIGEISVTTIFESEFLTLAARKYEESHSGTKINIVSSYAADRDMEKYSQIINTELMSGGGEDIIDVSRISWDKLADRGALLDLNEFLDLTPEEYHMGVMDAYLYNGKRYVVPMCFHFTAYKLHDAYVGKEPAEDKALTDLIAIADKYPDAKVIDGGTHGMDPAQIASETFSLDFAEYIDLLNNTADVNNEKFIRMLLDIQAREGQFQYAEQGEDSVLSQYSLYGPAMSSAGIHSYDGFFLNANESGQGVFSTMWLEPAINANTQNPELAADFIRFLLSEEMQSSPELMYASVNKKGMAALSRFLYESSAAEGYAPEDYDFDKNVEAFNDIASRLSVRENRDTYLEGFIGEEIQKFFDGSQTAERAAENLQFRLNTYLQE
ncbi:MAG: extracellular solute-binding protein [Clostridiales bacterium]|jgi:multiple sugar transport system substrate-binding protein|nr:extracellular solute-binding protein [Clostridiales bacterium]